MITKLSVSNFKSVRRLDIDCKKVNLFIGEPNTGKSNILEALALLSWCAHPQESPLAGYVRFESTQNLFFDQLLDLGAANLESNYVLLSGGNDRTIGTVDDVLLPVELDEPYRIGSNSVRLVQSPVDLGETVVFEVNEYLLTVSGAGIRNPFDTVMGTTAEVSFFVEHAVGRTGDVIRVDLSEDQHGI